ncbi:Retinol dehydrogenase 5 [Irineochytrium annulatum]|nr:Retinol dehydrogenase 5 [Irineochytrium annulatum]
MGAFLSSSIDLDQLRGKSVVITGCDTGFGNMTAMELISHGLNVYAGCLTEQGRQGLISQCKGLHPKVASKGVLTALILDVTKDESVAAFTDAVDARVPEGIYALVNNAGIAGVGPFELMPQADHRLIFEVNYFGPLRMMHAFLPSLRRFAKTHPRSRPRLVNVASLAGRTVTPHLSAYGASKHAIRSLTDSVRVELRAHGVMASCIEPIFARTNMVTSDKTRQITEQFGRCDEEVREAYGGEALIERIRGSNEMVVSRNLPGFVLRAETVVEKIVMAVESPKPRAKYLHVVLPLTVFFGAGPRISAHQYLFN